MILIDKPFTIGQFIAVDSVSATVEKIGVRSTHLRSLRGEIVVINNSKLTSSNIENFATMQQRRMIYSIGVTYQTTADQIQSIPTIIQTIIDNKSHAIFNRCHFTGFGDYSLNFEIVYHIDNRDYTQALDIQQSINLSIMRTFDEQGIEFAFPRQTLYLEGNGITAGAASS
jgi:small-conductance mechanosensitive channel